MTDRPGYSRLTPDELRALRAPGNEALMEDWLRTQGPLHGTVSMFSVTRPRPLYYFHQEAPGQIAAGLDALRGTPFHDRMRRNVEAAAEIRRMWEEQGHTDELHEAADAYLDALGDDYAAVTRHAGSAEPSRPAERGQTPEPRRRAAG
jgi:hypothetical protein